MNVTIEMSEAEVAYWADRALSSERYYGRTPATEVRDKIVSACRAIHPPQRLPFGGDWGDGQWIVNGVIHPTYAEAAQQARRDLHEGKLLTEIRRLPNDRPAVAATADEVVPRIGGSR